MLEMAILYRSVIDDITANKALKLRKFELDDEDWQIVSDLICVLKVCMFALNHHSHVNLYVLDL